MIVEEEVVVLEFKEPLSVEQLDQFKLICMVHGIVTGCIFRTGGVIVDKALFGPRKQQLLKAYRIAART